MEIHVISDGKMPLNQFARIAGWVEPYAHYFHLRERSLNSREIWDGIQLLRDEGVPLAKIVINDRVDVAAVAKVCGVQLAFHSLPVSEVKRTFPQLRIGRSVHSVEEAVAAHRDGADYVMYGHIYTTESKPGLQPRGLEALAGVVRAVPIPVIAIGGIKPEHVAELEEAGAAGIAVMSGVTGAENPLEAMQSYVKWR